MKKLAKIDMTRKEIIDLMNFLPEDHWMNERLADALHKIHSDSNNSFMANAAVIVKPKSIADYKKNNNTKKPSTTVDKDSAKTDLEKIVQYAEKYYKVDKGHCVWELYGYYCNKKVSADSPIQLCEDHIENVCTKCGKQAIHGCPIELQFVCGEPLCKHCSHYGRN